MLAPWKAKKMAEAGLIEAQGQVDINRLIGSAQAEALESFTSATSEEATANIDKYIESYAGFQFQKRLGNISSVAQMAADILQDKEVGEDIHVDQDWIARFFSDVQDVTSEDMQKIWAKILAGEVETPGRTSLHTLAILRNMSQHDAARFEHISKFVIAYAILDAREYTDKIPSFPRFDTLVDFESYGLLSLGKDRGIGNPDGLKYIALDEKSNLSIRITSKLPSQFVFPGHALTPQGEELYRMIDAKIDENYLRVFRQYMEEKHNLISDVGKFVRNIGLKRLD